MPLPQLYQPAKIRKAIPRPSTPWSVSFRRWARPFCPFVDRFTHVLDRLERQRQTLHFVHAFIDLARFPSIKSPTILTDIVLPLYIRWLQQRLSPAGTERPAAIIAPTVRHARAISRNIWQSSALSPPEMSSLNFLICHASHSPFSFNRLRGLTCHFALVIHTDRLRVRHHADRYSQLYRAIAPMLFNGNDSALIIVGDSRLHPRLSFARQSASPPYPLPIDSVDDIIILAPPDIYPIPPPPIFPILPILLPLPITPDPIL